MRNIKSEKGAITIIVLASVLLFTTFLVTTYAIISNKIKTQKDIIAETNKIYASENETDAYNSFFSTDGVIPIYTAKQLEDIGNENDIQINETGGKTYIFASGSTYKLMNNLEIETAKEIGKDDEWITLRNSIVTNNPNDTFSNKFIGNEKTITLTKIINSKNVKYEYNSENNYEFKKDAPYRIEYLEATDALNYIDTGIKFNSNQKIEIKVNIPNAGVNSNMAFGMRASGSNTALNSFYLSDGGLIIGNDSGYEVNTDYPYGQDVVLTFTGNTLTYNDTTITTTKTCTNTTNNLYLFCLNDCGSANYLAQAGTKIYYCKVYDTNGNLIQDLEPCIDQDNKSCFYDLIKQKCYYGSNSTTEFTKGGFAGDFEEGVYRVKPYYVEYVQSTNVSNYIDTGIKFNGDQKMEIKFNLQKGNGGNVLFGMRAGSATKSFYQTNGGLVIGDDSGYEVNASCPYNQDVVLTYTGKTLTYNDTAITTGKKCTNTAYNLYLFCVNESGRANYAAQAGTKIYYCKIWDANGNLIQELKPCVDKSDKVCFYDTVTKKYFYGSNTSTSFIAGNFVNSF
jgi:hypothetical protein